MLLLINKSRLLTRLIVASHLGVVPILAMLAVPPWLRLIAIVVVITSLLTRRRLLFAAARTLRIERDGSYRLTDGGGSHGGRVEGAAVFPLFVRLVLAGDGRRSRTLLVMRDAVDPELYRTLRAAVAQRRLPARADQVPA